MVKKPKMAIEVNRKIWVSIIDFLRIATPIVGVCGTILSGMVLNYAEELQHSIHDQTVAIQDLKTQVAVLSTKFDSTVRQVDDNKQAIVAANANFGPKIEQNTSDIKVILTRLQYANSK